MPFPEPIGFQRIARDTLNFPVGEGEGGVTVINTQMLINAGLSGQASAIIVVQPVMTVAALSGITGDSALVTSDSPDTKNGIYYRPSGGSWIQSTAQLQQAALIYCQTEYGNWIAQGVPFIALGPHAVNNPGTDNIAYERIDRVRMPLSAWLGNAVTLVLNPLAAPKTALLYTDYVYDETIFGAIRPPSLPPPSPPAAVIHTALLAGVYDIILGCYGTLPSGGGGTWVAGPIDLEVKINGTITPPRLDRLRFAAADPDFQLGMKSVSHWLNVGDTIEGYISQPGAAAQTLTACTTYFAIRFRGQ